MDQNTYLAENFVTQNQGRILRYTGSDSRFKDQTGKLEVIEDMNCCAPTNEVLFAFVSDRSRMVMSADQLLDHKNDFRPL